MPRPLGPVFRPGPVRDALGLVRLLWALDRESGGASEADFNDHLQRMNLLTAVGKTLSECLAMGQLSPETLGYRAAVSRSMDAMEKLAGAPWDDLTGPLVRLARDRVCGALPVKKTEREARRQASAARG